MKGANKITAKKKKPTNTDELGKEELEAEADQKAKKKHKREKEKSDDSEAVEEEGKEEKAYMEKQGKKKKRDKKEEVNTVVGKVSKSGFTEGKEDKEKVYSLPGQKHDSPDERDPLRIFFEVLYRQLPDNEMAASWMMEWGLLPLEVAKKVYEKKVEGNLKPQQLDSPVKMVFDKQEHTISEEENERFSKTMLKTKKRKERSNISGENDSVHISSKRKLKRHKVFS
ncbi:uncharacterized protein [Typha angustifolia]|uniref:uncharacterized protein n=1 Tax=Typha angustifolia TaxID=59011 RepID=UPI003C2AAD5E